MFVWQCVAEKKKKKKNAVVQRSMSPTGVCLDQILAAFSNLRPTKPLSFRNLSIFAQSHPPGTKTMEAKEEERAKRTEY